MKTLYAKGAISRYFQKRYTYHLAFGREPFEKILNRLISNALNGGRDIRFLMSLRYNLQDMIDRIPYTVKESEVYSFNDQQIQKDFLMDDQLFESEFYTLFLTANLLEQATRINGLTAIDSEILSLLQFNSEENELLNLYAIRDQKD